ncbi:MAG TPA: FlgD immunoglobulin-like domain containing protein [Candidatus Cloacimonadota bacterium]|nr:FlgD immunoglobulin-like domain containing protein [Candidatus Cloacimonadota bacterium]
MKNVRLKLVAMLALLVLVVGLSAIKVTFLRSFDIEPNPMDDHCRIGITIDRPMELNVRIEDTKGTVIKNLYYGHVLRGLTLTWDRYDNNGQYTPKGVYRVVVSTNDRYTSTMKTVILK